MARLAVSREAREDMAEIWSQQSGDHEGAADRVIASFDGRFTTVAGNLMADLSQADTRPILRSFLSYGDTIFYFPQEDGVEIVRVICGAQNTTTLF